MNATDSQIDRSGPQLLLLSAETADALTGTAYQLADRLQRDDQIDLADVAGMLQEQATRSEVRLAVVCTGREDAIEALLEADAASPRVTHQVMQPVVFVFPGLGNQYPGMAAELYHAEPAFAREIDECCKVLESNTGIRIRDALLSLEPAGSDSPAAMPYGIDFAAMAGRSPRAESLLPTEVAQPAMFILEYCLAKLWMHWGLRPSAMIGYSIGEYVAACLSGVFSRDIALQIVAERGLKIARLPPGAMLAVPMTEEELTCGIEGLFVAAVHGPRLCVLGGTIAAVEKMEAKLAQSGMVSRRVSTTHAFHTKWMLPLWYDFEKIVSSHQRLPPSVPFISNATGTWITAKQAIDPAYWANHMCEPVRFGAGVSELGKAGFKIFMEAGPGNSLSGLIVAQLAEDQVQGSVSIPTMPSSYQQRGALGTILQAAGRLWCSGVELDWKTMRGGRRLRPVKFSMDLATAKTQFSPRKPRLEELTSTEQALVEVWKDKLHCDIRTVRDEFFDLGGDSLIALQMLRAVYTKFGVKVTLREFLNAPVLASLAKRIDEETCAGAVS